MFLHELYWWDTAALHSPGTAQPLQAQTQHSQSPNVGQGGTFFPICPCPSACMGCGNMVEGSPKYKLGRTAAEHGEGAGCGSVTWAGKERCLPHPHAVPHCRAGQGRCPSESPAPGWG